MSVRVYWEDDGKTIVRYDFQGEWDWFVHLLYAGVKFYSKIGYYFRVAATLEEAHAMIGADRTRVAATPMK